MNRFDELNQAVARERRKRDAHEKNSIMFFEDVKVSLVNNFGVPEQNIEYVVTKFSDVYINSSGYYHAEFSLILGGELGIKNFEVSVKAEETGYNMKVLNNSMIVHDSREGASFVLDSVIRDFEADTYEFRGY